MQSTSSEATGIRQAGREHFFRRPDRPSTSFVPVRQRQSAEIKRARAQVRTAAWRANCDSLRRPEARDVGMALLTALVTSPHLKFAMTDPELRFVTAALDDLEARGFDREQVKLVCRRLRNRLLDPGDRQGEESETTGPAIEPTAWQQEATIF